MKKVVIIILFLANLIPSFLHSEEITLKYWKEDDKLTYYIPEGPGVFPYTHQFQRFDIPAPCYIKSMRIYLYGEPSTINVYCLDHQAGHFLPQVFAYSGRGVLGTAEFQFQGANQPTPIDINFPEPIYFDGDQVFIGVRIENRTKTFFISSQSEVTPFCQSQDGGNYGYQYFANYNATDQGQLWAAAPRAFLAELKVELAMSSPKSYLIDRTGTAGLPSTMSQSSIAFGDINDDVYQELLINGRLFLNSKDGYKEITTQSGLSDTPQGNFFIDIDNDGKLDIIFLFESSDGLKPMVLFFNNGDNTFTRKQTSLPGFRSVSGFAVADINNDNYPDFYVTQLWNPYPTAYPNYMFINDGKGGFKLAGGLCQTAVNRRSRGCQFVDYDNDGDLDLYVTNYYQEPDELWENKGDLVFVDVAKQKAIDIFSKDNKEWSNHGTGVDWYDYDNDGDMDLLLPQFAHPANASYGFRGTTIYKNQNGNFTDTYDSQIGGSSLGITYEETHAGAAWGDFDNDGLADFVITTYYGCRYIDLYKQTPDLKFKNVTYEAGLNRIVTGDDACWADYDNDGKLDLAMSIDRKFKLFKNYWSETNNNWVKLDLRSNKSNKFAIGARVKVYAGGKTYMQEVGAGRGQKMQKPYVLHFGIGQAQSIDKVEIRWPKSKEYVTYTNIPINQITKIVEEGVGVEQSEVNFSNYIHLTKSIIGNDDLEIEFGIAKSHNLLIEIVDLQGNVVISENLGNYNIGDYKHTIKIDKLQSGTYFVRLIVGGSTLFDKFAIVK